MIIGNKLRELIDKAIIKIEPLKKEQVGVASIDLTLSNEFRKLVKKQIPIKENTDFKKYTKLFKADKITLKPNAFVLGITKEKITLPENITGLLAGRSRFARLGLLVHATAPLIQPGVSNRQIFEIKNISNSNLVLSAGTRIGQLILFRAYGKGKYVGKFARQEEL